MIGLNCATGPAEMSEHLRYLSRHSARPISVMPNAGLPELGPHGATYPLQPDELAAALRAVRHRVRRPASSAAAAAPRPSTCAPSRRRCPTSRRHRRAARSTSRRWPRCTPSVPFRQDASVLMIGERTNANGSKAFREAMLAGAFGDCVEIARAQTRDGSHLLDLCVDYVGRDGVADMREIAGRFATASTLPLMLDSTEPPVIEAGLEMLGGRCAINSVNFEDGDGPGVPLRPGHAAGRRARRGGGRADHRRGRPGPHRGEEGGGGRAAHRRPHRRMGDGRVATSWSTA